MHVGVNVCRTADQLTRPPQLKVVRRRGLDHRRLHPWLGEPRSIVGPKKWADIENAVPHDKDQGKDWINKPLISF